MQGTAVYRLITPKIFTRIEVATNAKLIQLKQIIEERTQVKPKVRMKAQNKILKMKK